MGYSQIDNSYLDKPNGLGNAEFRVLMSILRLTSGFHRNKYKIKYAELTEMSGIKQLTRIVPILKQKGFIDFEETTGTSYTIRIKPINSVKGLPKKAINSLNDTHSVSEPHPLTQLNGSRGAKENKSQPGLRISFRIRTIRPTCRSPGNRCGRPGVEWGRRGLFNSGPGYAYGCRLCRR